MNMIIVICTIVLIAALLLERSGSWDRQALHTEFSLGVGGGETLIVLLPTIGGRGTHYEKMGFFEELRARVASADVVTLDVKPQLYLGRRIVEILRTEVVVPARAMGCQPIVLAGTSLDGHGALLYAAECPEDIDGVFLFAPFISGPLSNKAIEEAGGLDKWEDCPFIAWEHSCNVWKVLKDYVSDPKRRECIF